jgi:hypothetical protein
MLDDLSSSTASFASATKSNTNQKSKSATSYAEKYNRFVQSLRQALLLHEDDSVNPRQVVRKIFRRIDENGSGVLTAQEMRYFVLSPELGLFVNNSSSAEKFSDLLVQQIDINR